MCPHERHAIAVTGMRVRRPPRAHDACACYDRSHHSRAGRGCGTADDVIVFVRGTACPVLRVWPRGRHDLRLPATAAEESICTTTYNPARDGRARALPLGVVRTSTRFTSYYYTNACIACRARRDMCTGTERPLKPGLTPRDRAALAARRPVTSRRSPATGRTAPPPPRPAPPLHSQPFPVRTNNSGRAHTPQKSSNPLLTVFLFRWPPPAVVMEPPRAQISIK